MEIKTKRSKYSIIDLGILVNSEIKDDFLTIKRLKISGEEIVRILRKSLTDEEIMENLSSCLSLVLGVTEECNFRCKYCSFSGKYEGERIHNQKKMDIETAKKAVDLFFQLIQHKKRNIKRHSICVGFYGGECLLEFNLIKKVIAYSEAAFIGYGLDKRYNLLYSLTTNGYLLKGDIVDFLKEKGVLVFVSLDGPEEEHDKFRLTRKGQKTWTQIMDNLKRLEKRYPEYYDRNISYLVTIHPHHDCKAIDRFFLENSDLFTNENVKFNTVDIDRLNKDERDFLIKTAKPPSEMHFLEISREIPLKFSLKNRTNDTQITATCFPGGEKIHVSADGKLNICEKISYNAPGIGHVNYGFDFDSIRKIIRDYNEEIIKNNCWNCEYWFLCNLCIGNTFKDDRFEFNCHIERSYQKIFKKYLEKREEEDKNKYHNNTNGTSVIDFIDQL